ncbi:MAG: PIN domain-containing protein [Rhizobiaceae bacterium]
MPTAFLDSNIVVYAATAEVDAPAKAEKARQIIGERDFGISFQVLQEFFVTCKRVAPAMPEVDLDAWVASLMEFECVDGTPGLFVEAIAASRKFQISYRDGAIVAAARQLGATTLYTEDLNHGQSYDGVRAINPFV